MFTLTSDPSHSVIVSSSEDMTLKVWSIKNAELLQTLEGHTNLIQHVAIAPNGQHIVSLSKDHTLRVWDIQTGLCAFVSTLSSPPRCCDISRDSGTLVVGDELGRLHVYLLQTN